MAEQDRIALDSPRVGLATTVSASELRMFVPDSDCTYSSHKRRNSHHKKDWDSRHWTNLSKDVHVVGTSDEKEQFTAAERRRSPGVIHR